MIYYGMKVILLSKENLKKEIKIALNILQNGGVIVCPTDTVYGLLANATNRKAVQKVFVIKKRKEKNWDREYFVWCMMRFLMK